MGHGPRLPRQRVALPRHHVASRCGALASNGRAPMDTTSRRRVALVAHRRNARNATHRPFRLRTVLIAAAATAATAVDIRIGNTTHEEAHFTISTTVTIGVVVVGVCGERARATTARLTAIRAAVEKSSKNSATKNAKKRTTRNRFRPRSRRLSGSREFFCIFFRSSRAVPRPVRDRCVSAVNTLRRVRRRVERSRPKRFVGRRRHRPEPIMDNGNPMNWNEPTAANELPVPINLQNFFWGLTR